MKRKAIPLPVEEGVFSPSDEQIADLLQLLDHFQYKRKGSSGAIQNCFARLLLGPDHGQRVKIMLVWLVSAPFVLIDGWIYHRKSWTDKADDSV